MRDRQHFKADWWVKPDVEGLCFCAPLHGSSRVSADPSDHAVLVEVVKVHYRRAGLERPNVGLIVDGALFDADWERAFPDSTIVRCEQQEPHQPKHARHPLRGRFSFRAESVVRIVYCRSTQFSAADELAIGELVRRATARVRVEPPQFCADGSKFETAIRSSQADHLAIVGHFDGDGIHVGDDIFTPGSISKSLPLGNHINSLLLMSCNSGSVSGARGVQVSFAEAELAVGATPAVVGLVQQENTSQIASVLCGWIAGLEQDGGSILNAYERARTARPLRLFLREAPVSLDTRVDGTTRDDQFKTLCVRVAETVVRQSERVPLALSDPTDDFDQFNSYEIGEAIEPDLIDGDQRPKVLADLARDLISTQGRRRLLGMRLSGKSTAATLLCRELAHMVLTDPRVVDRLVLQVRLRDLKDREIAKHLPSEARSFMERLLALAARQARCEYSDVLQVAQSSAEKIVLVLDGTDEIDEQGDNSRRFLDEVLTVSPLAEASVLKVGRSEVSTGLGAQSAHQSTGVGTGLHETIYLRPPSRDSILRFSESFAEDRGLSALKTLDRLKAVPDQWLFENVGMLALWLAEAVGAEVPPSPAGIARAVVDKRFQRLGGTAEKDAAIVSEMCAFMRERGASDYSIDMDALVEHYSSVVGTSAGQHEDLKISCRGLLQISGVFHVGQFRVEQVTADIRFCELLAASRLTEARFRERLLGLISNSDLDGLVKRADLLGECLRASDTPAVIANHVLKRLARLDGLKKAERLGVLSLLGAILRASVWTTQTNKEALQQTRTGEVTFRLLCEHVRALGWIELRVVSAFDPVFEAVVQALWIANPAIEGTEARDMILGLFRTPLEKPQPRVHPLARSAKRVARPRRGLGQIVLLSLRGPLWLGGGLLISHFALWLHLLPLRPPPSTGYGGARRFEPVTEVPTALSDSDRLLGEIDSLLVFGTLAILFATRFAVHKMIRDPEIGRVTGRSRYTDYDKDTFHSDQVCSDALVRGVGSLLLTASTVRHQEAFLASFAARLDQWRERSDENLAALTPEALEAEYRSRRQSENIDAVYSLCSKVPQAAQDARVWKAMLRSLRWGSAIGEPESRRTLTASVALLPLAPFILSTESDGQPSEFLRTLAEWGLSTDVLKARAAAVALETTSQWFSMPGSQDSVALTTVIRLVEEMDRSHRDPDIRRSLFFASQELALARHHDVENPFADPSHAQRYGLHRYEPRRYEGARLARLRTAIDTDDRTGFYDLMRQPAWLTVYTHGLRVGWSHRPEWLASVEGCRLLGHLLTTRRIGLNYDLVDEAAVEVIVQVINGYERGRQYVKQAGLIPILSRKLCSNGWGVSAGPLKALVAIGDGVENEASVPDALRKAARELLSDEKEALLDNLCQSATGLRWSEFKLRERPELQHVPGVVRLIRAFFSPVLSVKRWIARHDRKLW